MTAKAPRASRPGGEGHSQPGPGAGARSVPNQGLDEERRLEGALLEAVAAGDPLALARLYDAHATALYTLAVRILGDAGGAEDLVHDLFIEISQRAGDFHPARGSVATWLRVRLRSRAIDRLRSQGARRALLRESGADEATLSSWATGSALPAEPDPNVQRVFQQLAGMTEQQRDVLELAYLRGLSQREIAQRCEIPIGTVKSRLSGAVAALRRRLQDPTRPLASPRRSPDSDGAAR